jgi:hypothetical protein
MNSKPTPARRARRQDTTTVPTISRHVPWRERPVLTMEAAAELLGCSRAKVYDIAAPKGDIRLKKLNGRTLVETASLIAHLERAEDFVPSGRDLRGAALARARRNAAPGSAAFPT